MGYNVMFSSSGVCVYITIRHVTQSPLKMDKANFELESKINHRTGF